MSATPAARPSITSMMFTALVMPTIHSTVTTWAGSSRSAAGMGSKKAGSIGSATMRMETPLLMSTRAAAIWPSSFARGVSTRKSSNRPTMSIMEPARRRPRTSGRNSKVSARCRGRHVDRDAPQVRHRLRVALEVAVGAIEHAEAERGLAHQRRHVEGQGGGQEDGEQVEH